MSRFKAPTEPSTRPRRALPGRLWAFAAVALAIAACTDDPAAPTGTQIAGAPASNVPGSAQARPATPTPATVPSPVRQNPADVATLPPMGGTPAPSASLGPVTASTSPIASPSPDTSPSPASSASPSASPSPSFKSTGVATDLYLSGPGYFLLSTKAAPTTLEDLLFTRNGHLKLKTETVDGISTFRLVHADDDLYVLGFAKAGASTSVGVPDEASGVSEAVLAPSWGGAASPARALSLDAERNVGADTKLSFGNNQGLVRMSGLDPRTGAGEPLTAYVGVVEFTDSSKLVAMGAAYPGVYRFDANAGQLFVGIAYPGAGRTVGNRNLIKAASLEQ